MGSSCVTGVTLGDAFNCALLEREKEEKANLSSGACRYISSSRLGRALGRRLLSLGWAVSQGRHGRPDLTDPLVHFFGSLGRQVQPPLHYEKKRKKKRESKVYMPI
jgi:hypothetical protein